MSAIVPVTTDEILQLIQHKARVSTHRGANAHSLPIREPTTGSPRPGAALL